MLSEKKNYLTPEIDVYFINNDEIISTSTLDNISNTSEESTLDVLPPDSTLK